METGACAMTACACACACACNRRLVSCASAVERRWAAGLLRGIEDGRSAAWAAEQVRLGGGGSLGDSLGAGDRLLQTDAPTRRAPVQGGSVYKPVAGSRPL